MKTQKPLNADVLIEFKRMIVESGFEPDFNSDRKMTLDLARKYGVKKAQKLFQAIEEMEKRPA